MYLLITPPGFEKMIAEDIPGAKTIGIHSRIFVEKLPRNLPLAVRQVYRIIKEDFKLDQLRLPKEKGARSAWLLIKEFPKQDLDYDQIRESLKATDPDSKNVFRLDMLHGKNTLSKLVRNNRDRDYQVKKFPFSLKPEIAYCMVRLVNPNERETIYDPFCGSGTIPIEAALHFGPGYSFMGSDINSENIDSCAENSKRAGVRQHIHFFVHDVNEKSDKKADYVVSELPFQFKEGTFEMIYNNLLLLRPKQFVLLVSETPILKKMMRLHGYRLSKEIKVIKGGYPLRLLVFDKLAIR